MGRLRASSTTALLGVLAAAVLVAAPAAQALTETQKLTARDANAFDSFGGSVAISGDTAFVGAHLDDEGGSSAGAAYVFVRSGGIWTQQQKLIASDAAAGDQFGWSVAITGDTAVVGAFTDDAAGEFSGSAYVFVRSGGVWTQQQKLIASDGAAGDEFGESVAISEETVVVGAFADDDAGERSGSAYVFVRSGSIWTQQQKLLASDGSANDGFGGSVAASGDTLIVATPFDDDGGINSGSAYLFERSDGVWTQHQKLTPSDGSAGDLFGVSVAMQGDTAVVGAFGDDDAGESSGSAYVFVRGVSVWVEAQKLRANDAAEDDQFGSSAALSGDAAVIGAQFDDGTGTNSGSAYLFARNGGVWTQRTKLFASDVVAFDIFGFSAAIDRDTAVVGAPLDDDAGTSSGSVYVFDLVDTDGDGLSDTVEARLGTSPTSADSDGDGVGDFLETNGGSPVDTDADGTIDALDPDADGDGIPDSIEGSSDGDGDGIPDYRDADSDADGLPDGSDPDTVSSVVAGLPDTAFSSPGHRTSIRSILEDAEQLIAAGDRAAAIRVLSNLRRHVDGCEAGDVRDDWIVSCPEQELVRDLIDTLIGNLD